MATDCEVKIRTAAKANATLQSFFGPPSLFRWFDRQLPQGYYPATSVRVRRISTLSQYVMEGPNPTEKIRFQIDVLDPDPGVAKAAARAIIDWFATVNFTAGGSGKPNFQANQRSGMDPELQPPAMVESLDYFVYNDATT